MNRNSENVCKSCNRWAKSRASSWVAVPQTRSGKPVLRQQQIDRAIKMMKSNIVKTYISCQCSVISFLQLWRATTIHRVVFRGGPGVSHVQQVSAARWRRSCTSRRHHKPQSTVTVLSKDITIHSFCESFIGKRISISLSSSFSKRDQTKDDPELKIREEQSTVITCSKLGRAQLHWNLEPTCR